MAKQVTITIGEMAYIIEMDWAALRRLGVVHPLDQDEVNAANAKLTGTMDDICEWVSAGLQKHHPDMTAERVLAVMDYETFGGIVAQWAAALQAEADARLPLPVGDSSTSMPGSVSVSECSAESLSPSA